MALITPIPYFTLTNGAIPGLTSNLRCFDQFSAGWETLPSARRIQVLDDAVAVLRHDGRAEHEDLIRDTERELHVSLFGNPTENPEPLLSRLSQALDRLKQAGYGTVARDPLQERYRLITLPLDPREQSSISIRGPAGFLRQLRPGNDLMSEFGKVALRAWGPDVAKAREAINYWTVSPARARNMEIQLFASSKDRAEGFVGKLSAQGFDVRVAPIPAELRGDVREDAETVCGRKVAYWIVGRHNQVPLDSWLRKFADGGRSATIERLDLFDRTETAAEGEGLEADLFSLFGRPVSYADIVRGFAVDVPGYATRRVHLDRHESGGVSLLSEIVARKTGDIAAQLSGWLPLPPKAGEPWIAQGVDLNEGLYKSITSQKVLQHFQRGIGRRSLVKILVFLQRLGVNGLDMSARGHGVSFMSHIGFDFQNKQVRQEVLDDFRSFLESSERRFEPATLRQTFLIRHAWELVDFQNERGEPLGRQFLDDYAHQRKQALPLRFWLDANYDGWRRLFSRQLEMDPPETEVSDVQEETDQRIHLAMMERAEGITRSGILVDPNLPVEYRRRDAEKSELIHHLLQQLQQAETNADVDSLTKLLVRRAFLRHNRALEQSLSSNRQGDGSNEHWGAMIDIDFFKRVNDEHGHAAGDEALRLVAQVIQASTRSIDLLCRWGGEEFALILPHSGIVGARSATERIRAGVERIEFRPGGKLHPLSVTIGAAPFRVVNGGRRKSSVSGEVNQFEERPFEEHNSMTVTLAAADERLYQGKKAGRNRIIYEETSVSFG